MLLKTNLIHKVYSDCKESLLISNLNCKDVVIKLDESIL